MIATQQLLIQLTEPGHIWFAVKRLPQNGENRWIVTELMVEAGCLWCGLRNLHTGDSYPNWLEDSEIVSLG